jgi:hypothetical protein
VTPDTLAPPFFLAAGLLVLAGAVKVVTPATTAQAILDAGLPGSRPVARGVGLLEIAAGTAALLAPAAGGAIACGALYLAFAGFLGYVLLAHPDAGSCGCAGPTPVPPSRLHLTLNVLASFVAFGYASTTAPSVIGWLNSLGWAAVPVTLGLALAGWLAVVAVTVAPEAFRAWTPPVHDHDAEPHGHDHAVADRELESAGVVPGHASLWPGTKG